VNTKTAELLLQAYAVPDDFLNFLKALQTADAFAGSITNVIYAVEKPWKYANAYAIWGEVGKPTEPEDLNGELDARWERFATVADG
jgi:hypothetical protein